MITLIELIMLIIFAVNFNEKLASYSQLTSMKKIVNEINLSITMIIFFTSFCHVNA